MFRLVLGLSFLAFSSAVSGWTYKTTPSTCGANTTSPCGPAYWGKVSSACSNTGSNYQSPIKLDVTDVTLDNSIPLPSYSATGGGCKSWVQFTNTYTFEVSFAEAECENLTATYKNEEYFLSQIHFHSPSEHTIGGGRYPAEAHMVHQNAAKTSFLVVGVLLLVVTGTPLMNNTFLTNFWNAGGWIAPAPGIEATHYVNATTALNPYAGLVPGRQGQYVFQGSLTTPPCSEPVNWFLYDEPVAISVQDLAYLRRSPYDHPSNIMSSEGNSNRPFTQALNGRTVYYTTGNAQITPTASPTVSPAIQTATIIAGLGLAFSLALLLVVGFLFYKQMNAPVQKTSAPVSTPASDSNVQMNVLKASL